MQIEKYLPSKKFLYLLGSFAILALVFFIIFKLFSNKNSFFTSKTEPKLQTEKMTVNQLIQKDSDDDGIFDWEEALWGTDPKNKSTFEGILDADYIRNKRGELKTETDIATNEKLTETDKFAREFFASYTAMKASGQVDDNTIKDFSTALAQKISDPSIVNQYSEKDIKITKNDEPTDKEDYYVTAGGLFEKYKTEGIGDELDIASTMAGVGSTTDNQNQDKLIKVAGAYKEFAKKLLLIPVPKSLEEYHLRIINSANKTGISVLNMSKMITDPIVGISGTSQYDKYSNELITAVNDLETFLTANDIIYSDSAISE
jgi:hypothetical protein